MSGEYTPTDDEREAVFNIIDRAMREAWTDADEYAYAPAYIRDAILAAGFRRTAVQEPSAHDGDCEADWGSEGQESPCRCTERAQGEPTDALIEEALTWIGQAWDDGNASGLDGWIGPGRGAGEVDREAQHARTRMVHKAEAALRAAHEEGKKR